MTPALLLLSVSAPMIVAALFLYPPARSAMAATAPWTAVFALAAAVIVRPGTAIDLPWIMLGARAGLDTTGKLFLASATLLWLIAGIYAQSYLHRDRARHRFFVFYLMAMAGNIGLIIAHDIITFVAFFSLMSFSAYGLVTHNRDDAGRRAGLVYIILVVTGEVLLFTGLVLAATQAGSLMIEEVRAGIALAPARNIIVPLLLAGFGIKLGVVPLHFWLPLAHPVAPTPASAVLSGAMIKAGLIGWMRFLPIGETAMPGWGLLCIVVGYAAVFSGVLVGLTQSNPKTVLAYSSVSQMGLIVVAVGSALTQPATWPFVSSFLAIYAFHHAIAKGSLFLGVGVAGGLFHAPWKRRLVVAGLVIPALALAGAPLTLGGAAKVALKKVMSTGIAPWAGASDVLLPLSALATTLLMARFLYLVWPQKSTGRSSVGVGMVLPWSVLASSVVWMTWVLAWHDALGPNRLTISPAVMWKSTWPIAAGGGLTALVIRWKSLAAFFSHIRIPAGDLVVPLGALLRGTSAALQNHIVKPLSRWPTSLPARLPVSLAARMLPASLSSHIENWLAFGLFAVLSAATLFLVLSI
jgi:formate hydrogenlyase subunit 3/multisubunit Na+/H+ antiporter MnhD subunit